MGVARRWIFPIIWMVIFAVIGAALVKLAFFAEASEESAPEFPTGAIAEPTVSVERGTIHNDVTVDGTIAADAAIPGRAAISGEVRKVSAAPGQWVDAGAELAQIRGMNDDGTNKWSILKAPASGTLSSFELIVGQQVGVGETIVEVAPPTFSVVASIAPAQQYRLTTQPTEAEVAITGGPAPFTCTGLTITAAPPPSSTASGADPGAGSTAVATVRCAVPSDVKVFAGLAAKVTIAGGVAEDVLVVPTTAVEGGSGTGVVYVSSATGEPETREVTLGISDGTLVEVASGLDEGDTVLQFVPGAPADTQNGAFVGVGG
ncbi:efflux RND transporter periplasmic adaptor subunit [Protaetiibacter larvae]|uniref:efflux RND transporter periplasmic adaptor subunit n=1 Tax=Protaetiibacter larvae TaxID=2592654 RepID=UPI001FEA5768|nr:efflux RND transporter periplasmic adaptor subunit [Protaetiibacter larvae]